MNQGIIIAVITVCGSLLAAAASYMMTKYHERMVEQQKEKLNHYKVLLTALSGIAGDRHNMDATKTFALAFNTIGLVAPQYVIDALLSLHDAMDPASASRGGDSPSNRQGMPKDLQLRLNALMLAVRKDMGRAKGDNPETFTFRLLSAGGSETQRR